MQFYLLGLNLVTLVVIGSCVWKAWDNGRRQRRWRKGRVPVGFRYTDHLVRCAHHLGPIGDHAPQTEIAIGIELADGSIVPARLTLCADCASVVSYGR